MFGNLFHSGFSKFSNFFSSEPFVASESEIETNRKANKFLSETQPYGIFTGNDTNLNLGNLTATYDIGNKSGVPTITPLNAPPNTQNANTGDLFERKEKECVTANGGSTFNRLSYLTGNQSSRDAYRCGWIYDNADPENGVGAYGSRNGPILSKQQGQWYWNLADAKEKFHTNLCKEVKDCGDLDADRYRNICGYCTTSQTAIPISGTNAAYPYTSPCVTSALVTSANKCPRPEPTPNPSAFQNSQMPSVNLGKALNACDPFENGRLAAACLISKASQAGCSENGSLITSLKTGSSTNYFESLQQVPAYKEYQRRTDNSINEAALKQGRATLNLLLSQFGGVKSNTRSSNQGLQASARDLCLEKGSFETFDFCAEIKDTDYTPSISLDCIQREFLRGGGQRTGKLYPTQENISYWREFTPWRNLKAEINRLKTLSMARTEGFTSVTSTEVSDAVNDFQGLGVTVVKRILGKISGVEIFLFKGDTEIKAPNGGVFLGRIIRPTIPNLPDPANSVDNTKLTNTAFMFITNVLGIPDSDNKYNIKLNSDAGFILTKNKPFEYIYNGGGAAIKDSELSSLYTQFKSVAEMSSTQQGGGGSWTFNDSGPNIILGYSAGGTTYNLRFSPDTGLPPECGCYGRSESGLRLYNKDECNLMGGNHYPSGECLAKTSGSYSWTCRNIPSPCRNGWNPLANTMCFLTQEAAAPMISFNVELNYTTYNSPYPFCDRRLGSHKMTWAKYVNPPTWVFRENSTDTNKFPLGLNYASMVGGGMFADFSFKRNSFQTMVIMLRFTRLPPEGNTGDLLIFWPTDWSYGAPALYVETTNNITRIAIRTGSGNIFSTRTDSNGNKLSISTNNPQIRTGVTYIVTLRMTRETPNSLQLISMRVGVGLLSVLQRNTTGLTESDDFKYENKLQLDNLQSNLSDRFLLPPADNCHYDLFSIQLFDYAITNDGLKIIANNDWSRLQGGIFT